MHLKSIRKSQTPKVRQKHRRITKARTPLHHKQHRPLSTAPHLASLTPDDEGFFDQPITDNDGTAVPRPLPELHMDILMAQCTPPLSDEFDAIPEEQMDTNFIGNLHKVMNQHVNLGYKAYGETITGIKRPDSGWQRNEYVDVAGNEERIQREHQKEDLLSKARIASIIDRSIDLRLEKETFGLTATEAELEQIRQNRNILKPIRNLMPHVVKELVTDLINEAKSRNLDEHGKRDFSTPAQLIPGHSADKMINLNGNNIHLGEIQDGDLIKEITRITVTWNRSGSRNKPLPEDTLEMSNKAKLEEGVSNFFSSNKTAKGREFSYDIFLNELKTEHDLDKAHIANYTEQPQQLPQNQPQFTQVSTEIHVPGHDETNIDASNANNPHNIHIPPHIQNLVKQSSPFNQLEVKKPQLNIHSQLPSTPADLETQLIHQDFLHNSALRRKPVGKLTDIQVRDLLVDASRFHSIDAILDHYSISMLSLFEDQNTQQPMAHAADIIGGFAPVNMRVKADFDEGFIKLVDTLHKHQMLLKQQKQATLGSQSPQENREQATIEAKYLDFMKRVTSSQDGYITLNKDDVLIPEFPDSMLELLLNESLDKGEQVKLDENQDSMRSTMIKELLILKGKTIGELHQLGIFNQAPYDINNNNFEYSQEQHRNKYAFNDEVKHFHRATTSEEMNFHRKSLYGGSRGQGMREEYYGRVESKFGVNKEHSMQREKNDTSMLYQHAHAADIKPTVGGKGYVKLAGVSRFSQLALAATVVSKYGSLNEQYRTTAGINMETIDNMITDALEEGDVEVSKLLPLEKKKYIDDLKQECLTFPEHAIHALLEHVRVPYLVLGHFDKIPSRFLGVKDYETATNPSRLTKMGISNSDTYPLGPYHPLFLVTIGGKGYHEEVRWEPQALRAMLGGEIDDIRRAEKRTKDAGTIHTPVGKSVVYKEVTNLNEIAEIGEDDSETEKETKDEKTTQITRKVLPSSQQHNLERHHAYKEPEMDDITLNDDPNEIRFNTSSMTEFHHVNIVNEDEISLRSKKLIDQGFKTVEQFKQFESHHDESVDPSPQWSLKHFVKTEYQHHKAEKLSQNYGVSGKVNDAHQIISEIELNDPLYYAEHKQKVYENFDISKYSPDEFHGKRMSMLKQSASSNLQENAILGKDNEYHELYGGPVTVEEYITKITETEEGKEISHKVTEEHKSWLGDLLGAEKKH